MEPTMTVMNGRATRRVQPGRGLRRTWQGYDADAGRALKERKAVRGV
jgi:hypothetical protein